MAEKECIDRLSDVLFWDIDKATFSMSAHSGYIVQRVLEYGTMDDWRTILSYYGLAQIVEICKGLRTLDPVCLSFISAISNTNKEDYRCYHTRQSSPTLWNS